MIDTTKEFKEQQKKAEEVFKRLAVFLDEGEVFGIKVDSNIKDKISNAIKNIGDTKLKIALIGGFSEGKTTIAAAWLGKLDKSSMKISHEESSDEVKIYNVDNEVCLVDTPGLFGFKEKEIDSTHIEKYKDITKKYISDAHLILYVMNSQNPIKESHKDDLQWLFTTLNLLPRTIFVLSRFDEVVDIEDDNAYNKVLEIKQQNVISRLKDTINLSNEDINTLSIVGIAANPFDEGVEYWLENPQEFKQLSHIESLQRVTYEKIKSNGGFKQIIDETHKSIVNDVLYRQIPIIEEINKKVEYDLIELNDNIQYTNKSIEKLSSKITNIKVTLRDFVIDEFTDIILQLQGTTIETFNDFFERNIGDEGLNLRSKIQNKFENAIGLIQKDIESIAEKLELERSAFDTILTSYGKQGIKFLQQSNMINATNIKIARDLLVSGLKKIGIHVVPKFKPWGAIKFAKNAGAALALLNIAIELWDSYKNHEKEEKFREAKKLLEKNLNDLKKELLSIIDNDEFVSIYFPAYIKMEHIAQEYKNTYEALVSKQKDFKQWVEKSKAMEKELKTISYNK